MSSRNQPVPEGVRVEQLREAARERVLETSLRVAAAEIDLSHRGLEGFIKGSRPRPQTIRKLTEWYLKRVAAGAARVVPELAQAALTVLVEHVPLERREIVADHLLAVLRQETQTANVPLPSWLLRASHSV
jgi:hypothetical protein